MPRPVIIGFFAPLIALLFIMIAIALAPAFTWWGNALSDLGHYTRVDIGPNPMIRAIVFNSGLIVTGLLMLYFTIWFIRKTEDTITRFGMLPFVSAVLFLMAIGIFSENFGDLHFYVSVGFFASFPFAMWIVGGSWFRFPELRWFSLFSIILPIISVIFWGADLVGLSPWPGVAIPEIVTALTAIGWTWIVNLLYHKGKLSAIMKSETI
ncbi:MAG: DUF998 domain-containing protein [Candidatus Thorarchaeota archaeon]